jgi:hypothetical protein
MSIADELGLKPQTRKILAHLRSGRAITPLKARAVYRIESLSSRIAELRSVGYGVVADLMKDEAGKRYASYTLTA